MYIKKYNILRQTSTYITDLSLWIIHNMIHDWVKSQNMKTANNPTQEPLHVQSYILGMDLSFAYFTDYWYNYKLYVIWRRSSSTGKRSVVICPQWYVRSMPFALNACSPRLLLADELDRVCYTCTAVLCAVESHRERESPSRHHVCRDVCRARAGLGWDADCSALGRWECLVESFC